MDEAVLSFAVSVKLPDVADPPLTTIFIAIVLVAGTGGRGVVEPPPELPPLEGVVGVGVGTPLFFPCNDQSCWKKFPMRACSKSTMLSPDDVAGGAVVVVVLEGAGPI